MTRLTKDARDAIFDSIVRDLRKPDYLPKITEVLQGLVCEHMDPKVRAVYEDSQSRDVLVRASFRLSYGKDDVRTYERVIYGVFDSIEISLVRPNWYKLGSLEADIQTTFIKNGLVRKHLDETELYRNVTKRLRGNIDAAQTVARLREILEPELHRYIPADEKKVKEMLPSVVAPVADDLKKFGLKVA